MACPQLANGFLRLSNELAEAFARTPLNGSQLRILFIIVRECYGRDGGRKMAPLTMRQIASATGLNYRTVRRETAWLQASRILAKQEGRGVATLFGVNKDWESWDVRESSARGEGLRTQGGRFTPSNGVNKPFKHRVNVPPYEKKGEEKKLHGRERHADPRFVPIKAHYVLRTEKKTGVRTQFDNADGAALKRLLQEQPQAIAQQVVNWLDHAFDSPGQFPLQLGFRMTEFARHYAKYTSGPLNGHSRVTPPTSKPMTQEEAYRLKKEREKNAATRQQ